MCSKMQGIAVAQFRAFYPTGNFLRSYLAITASYEAQYLRPVLSLSSTVVWLQAKVQQEHDEQSGIIISQYIQFLRFGFPTLLKLYRMETVSHLISHWRQSTSDCLHSM